MAVIHGSKEFDAINVMLAKIGRVPMISFDDSEGVDPQMARNTLRQTNALVQAEGWYFNTEHNYPLERNADGEIYIDADIARVDIDAAFINRHGIDPVQRGTRLYDRANHTYVFENDIEATIVRVLSIEELPELARQYITLKAAQAFHAEVIGSATIDQLLSRDTERARTQLYAEHIRVSGLGLFSGMKKSTFGRRIPQKALLWKELP